MKVLPKQSKPNPTEGEWIFKDRKLMVDRVHKVDFVLISKNGFVALDGLDENEGT